MIGSVVLPDTTAEEWPAIRQRVFQRLWSFMGVFPEGYDRPMARWEEVRRYEAYGFEHILIRYFVYGDHWNEAIVVVPAGASPENPAPAVLTMHGANAMGKESSLDPSVVGGNRFYGIELARRGYVTCSPDQYCFGPLAGGRGPKEVGVDFHRLHPEWSLDGVRLLEQKRALDVLETMPFVRSGGFGVMGNSLGGRATSHLAALEDRIVAAVSSTGVSPNLVNAHRSIIKNPHNLPLLIEHMIRTNVPPWEYNELLALCAPRAVLLLEPFNDPYNPQILAIFACVQSAFRVYQLIGAPANLQIVVHGFGHDTPGDVRDYAYRWFDAHLK
ncbi:MAG: dienelactone hydrolase family protein [Candidatus Sumerlaeota bacterium]|nr:dienelactone hydrolase family protein [Candidatus Sumerlaeota bacterium]